MHQIAWVGTNPVWRVNQCQRREWQLPSDMHQLPLPGCSGEFKVPRSGAEDGVYRSELAPVKR